MAERIKPVALDGKTVELLVSKVNHRLAWCAEGQMPADMPDIVRALAAHALATKGVKRRRD